MDIEEVIQADDASAFLEIITSDYTSNTNYALRGSKKNCVFCKCAYHGSDSCIEASLAAELMCNHSEKNASYFAAAENQIQVLILLSNDNANFENAVLGAIKYGQYQSFMWLLENNYDETMRDLRSNHSIFLKCAKGGNPKIFQYLIQNFPDQFNYSINSDKKVNECKKVDNLLRVATKYNHKDIVDMILLHPEYLSVHDIVPLKNSIQNKNCEMTKKLVEITRLTKSDKIKLFNMAIDCQNVEIITLLSEKYNLSLNGIIFKAVCSNSIEFVRQILEKGIIDINEKNEYGIL